MVTPESHDLRSSASPRPDRRGELASTLQQAGLLTSIPFVLLVGPALGYYLGTRIDQWWAYAPWGLALGLVLGMTASARVTIDLIKRAQHVQRHGRTNSPSTR